MTKRAAWILVLLVALLAISVSVAFAASMTRPAQAALTPKQELSTVGQVKPATLSGISGGNFKTIKMKSERHTHCHLEDDAPVH